MAFIIQPVSGSQASLITNGSISLTLPQNVLGGLQSLGWENVIGPNRSFDVEALRGNIAGFLKEGRADGLELPQEILDGLRQFSETGDLTERVIVQLGTLFAAHASLSGTSFSHVSEIRRRPEKLEEESEISDSRLSLSASQQSQYLQSLLLQTGLVDGPEWRSESVRHGVGRGLTQTARHATGEASVASVAAATFDALHIIPESLRTSPARLDTILVKFFTETELNQDNLGATRGAQDTTKFYSRVAGLLSLKAAIFRAAGLPLPGEAGGEDLKWTDVEYTRQAFNTAEGQLRYRRVRNFSGELARALEGKGAFANFTDEGNTGAAIVVVENSPGQSGIVSVGIDITDVRRFASPQEAAAHTRGETAYKLTYLGGHQTYYLDNVVGEVIPGEVIAAGRRSYAFRGLTERSLHRLGGERVVGTELQCGWLAGSAMVAHGRPTDASRSRVSAVSSSHSPSNGQNDSRHLHQNTGDIPAPPEVRPALAEMLNNGDVNVIYALPGQASEYASWLIGRYAQSATAKAVVDAQAARLKEHGIDLLSLLKGGASPDLLASSAFSQPLIGLTQAVINAELREMGYDLGKAVVIGHSQGQVMGLHAVGALSDDEIIDFLAINGKLMQASDPLFSPEVGDPLTLMAVATAGSSEQLDLIAKFTGKISMITTLGISRDELSGIVEAVNKDLGEGELAQISLVNVEPGNAHKDLAPAGFEPHAVVESTGVIVSGTTDALKEVSRRVGARGEESGKTYKVRALATTAAFHSELMRPALEAVWPHLEGKKLGEIPTAVLMNHDGSDLRDVSGTVTRTGPDGREYQIDARVAAVTEGQYVRPVNWPTVVWSAFNRIDFSKPTVVIDGGPGAATGKFVEGNLTDAKGRSPVTVVAFGTPQGEAILKSGDPSQIKLVDPKIFTDPNYRPLLSQADKGAPVVNGEYTGPFAYLAQTNLADPAQRRDLIRRLEKALNLDKNGEPRLHSEVLGSLGYDPSMPLTVAAMTGNNRAELVAAMAANHYLAILATTTFGPDFDAISREFERIHEMTKEKLREAGDPNWEKGAPFGANLIHGDPFGSWKEQIKRILAAHDQGIPINVVSIAFSLIQYPEWKEFYQPLLDRGIALMPLGENEGRWDHFLKEIFPEVPENQRHLLLIAPEGGEGGGHNVPEKAANIRYGRDLTRSLLDRGGIKSEDGKISVPWFMTGGQTTPEALADALLVMANQPLRGGMQVGGMMQVALESAPPPQIKEFIADAAAGVERFTQIPSEFDRSINLVENSFARDMVGISGLLEGAPVREIEVPDGQGGTRKEKRADPVGRERAEKIADIFFREPLAQRQLLHRLWLQGLKDFNRKVYQPHLDRGWPEWLADDREGLVNALADKTPRDIIVMFRSYRTWALMESDIDPQRTYVLGGKSIRAMGRSLEAEGQDPKKYLHQPAPEIFRDLRDRTVKFLANLYERAMTLEEAEADRYAVSTPEQFQSVAGVKSVREESLGDGETNLVVEIGKDLNREDWLKTVLSAGHGSLARALRANEVGLGSKEGNPLHRALDVERGDRVEITRREESGHTVLGGLRIFGRSGRLEVEIAVSPDQKTVNETWYLAQSGGQSSPVTWNYEVRTGLAGSKSVAAVAGNTAAQGREAYIRLWVGENATAVPMGETASATLTVAESEVLAWHRQVGATSRHYSNPKARGFQVHPTYPLKAAWASMMQVGMDPSADIDFLKVVHSGQSMRLGAPVRVGDTLTASSRMSRIEDQSYGREATISTQVVNQAGETVAEYETKFLSRVPRAGKAVVFEAAAETSLSPTTPQIALRPLEVYRREKFSLKREDITGYALDDQWLHKQDRFARRVGFKNGIIAQGWRILHGVSHSLVEGYLKNNASRFIGFGEGTAVTAPVLPGEELTLEVDRVGIRGDREVLSFRLVPDGGGNPKASGTIELRGLPTYAGVFPGNASQKVGMAKELYLAQGAGRDALVEATTALGAEGTLLLDVITGGASLPEGDEARKAAYDKAVAEGWLNDVVNSSPAVAATSLAYFFERTSQGFPRPVVVSGHSLGQYNAAVAAGAVSLKDLMSGVTIRGELLRRHAAGKIASVMHIGRLEPATLEERLAGIRREGEVLEVANINTITDDGSQIVISGHEKAVERAVAELGKLDGYKTTMLAGNVAFHSSLVQAMEAEFREYVGTISIKDPEILMASIVEPGKLLRTADEVREELVQLNHGQVKWDANIRELDGAVAAFVEFGAGRVLTNFNSRILPKGITGSISTAKDLGELLFGERPKPKTAPVVAVKPAAPPQPVQAGTPQAVTQRPALEPTPTPFTTSDMAALDLRLSSARVSLDGGAVASVALSPIAPALGASPSEFLWNNLVLTLAEAKPDKVKPSEITPDTNMAKDIGLDSLDIATFFGWVRNRNFITRMPTDEEVKGLEQGTLKDAFALAVSYWDHPGEKPSLERRGTVTAPSGKTYKEILEAAGIKGDEVSKLIANGKLSADTPGIEALVSVLSEANEGAVAGVSDHLKRLEDWKYSDNFATQAANLRAAKTSLYLVVQPVWEDKKTQREQRNARIASMTMMGPMMGAAPAGPVTLEPTPAPFTTSDMAALDLRLSSARVSLDGGAVASVALSPIAPALGSSPSEFLWNNLVLTLAEAKPDKVKPSEITPDTNMAKDIGLDSLDIATFFGWVRNRNFITRMPTDEEVKGLEQGTLKDAFALAVSYWDHPGEKPSLERRGTVTAPAGRTYKEILESAGIKGDEVSKLIANGKLAGDTPGVEALISVLGEANEGAVAGVADHLKRLEDWKYSDNFATQAANLRAVKTSLYQAVQPAWEQQRSDREARNAAAQARAAQSAPGMMMPMGAAADPKQIEEIARRVAAEVVRTSQSVGAPAAATSDTAVEFDDVSGKIVVEGQSAALADRRALEAIRSETSAKFVGKLESKWSGRIHEPWANAAQNGAPENLLRLFREVSSGELDPDSEYGQARMSHLANQMDEARIDYARRLARQAERRGLTAVRETLDRVVAMAKFSLEMEKEGKYHLPIVWDVRHRGLSSSEFVDHLETSKQIDAKTAADLRAMIRGEVNFVGKRVLVYAGTGTISNPTVKFFLQLGADVWITTRQSFGNIERAAATLRNENAVRSSRLQVSTQWTPNYHNIEALFEEHKKQGWKPDMIVNGAAAEDYGPINARGDFEMVMRTLVGDFRYAVGQYVDWYKNDQKDSPTLTAHNQFSPQHEYLIPMSQTYIAAKAAYRPTYWAERRQAEKLFYEDGRPMVRGVSLETGLVVEDETPALHRDKSITGQFSPLRREFEEAAREKEIALTVFSSEEFGPINVAPFNPSHGVSDQTDREANGGFDLASGLDGGINSLSSRAGEIKRGNVAEPPSTSPSEPEPRTPTGWHPYQDGGLTTVTDYAFHIAGEDGAASPYNDIADEDLVIVGVGAASTYGGSLVDTAANLWQVRGGVTGPWGENVGIQGTVNYVGLDPEGRLPSEKGYSGYQPVLSPEGLTEKQVQRALSVMGPRKLVRSGVSADRRPRFEKYQGKDEVMLGPVDLVQKNPDLKKKLRMYRDSGYRMVRREELSAAGQKVTVVVMIKDKTTLARQVIDPVGPQVVADLPPFDWSRLGANPEVVDLHGRNLLTSGLALTEATRTMGLVPPQVVERHGENNVYIIGSDGMGPLELLGDQQVKPTFGEDPGEKAVVIGIPSAKAGRIAADHFGTRGPASDTPGACNTGPHSMWSAVQQLQSRFYEAEQMRRQAEGFPEGSDRRRILTARADRMRREALKSVVLVTTADDGATFNTMALFDRVGAMMKQASADAKEFPEDGHQRPHDKGRVAQFQSGVGGGALMITTGRMVREHGYRPIAKLTSVKVGTDGMTKEPDGKPRAWTGLGRWGQRNVFFQGLRAARDKGITLSNVYQMNSHSTGTGGDGTQSESFVIGAVSEAVENAAFSVAFGSSEFPRTAEILRAKGIDPQKYYDENGELSEKEGLMLSETVLRDLGLDLDHPSELMNQVRAMPVELREELGLEALIAESHAKGAGVRHTLGGTLLEFCLLLTQAIERRTLPHSYLNNLIDPTADNPLATTFRNPMDLTPVMGPRLRHSAKPDQVGEVRDGRRRHVRAVAGNSFGFNGLDGFEVAEIIEGMNFSSREEAVDWFADAIRNEALDIALFRATREGKQNAIQYNDSGHVDATAYPDTREGYEQAAELARRLVDREPGVVLPWQRLPRAA